MGLYTHTHTHTSSLNQRKEKVDKKSTLRVMDKIKSGNKNKRIVKSSALVLLILAFLSVVVICLNPTTRESIFNAISGYKASAEETKKEAQVHDNGSVILTDDSAVVESVALVNKITGTGPFDENDEPGNDSSDSNNVVRSFDTVTYEIEANISVNDSDNGSNDAKKYSSFRGGIINVEARIPQENAGIMKWSVEDMTWAEGTGKLSEDGLTFTGQYKMDENKITIPGKQTISVVLKVEGAGNGTKLNPTFKVWMQGNETDSSKEGYEAKEISDNEGITVSAKAGFNIQLKQASRYQVKASVDFGDGNGEVSGRMYGMGVIIQLYNQDTARGIKGLEYPKGDITFDIQTKLEAVETLSNGQQITSDITDLATPKLWNYKINIGSLFENPAYGNIPDRNMYFGNYTGYDDAWAPYGTYRTTRPEGVIYNSGNIVMQEQGNVIHTTINGYEFNGEFPKYYDYYTENSSVVYGANIGCFSTGFFQIFVPDNEETLKDRDYYLTVEDKNMVINTVSGQKVTNQSKTDDDSKRLQHYVIKPGGYYHQIYIYEDDGRSYLNYDVANMQKGKGNIGKNQNIQVSAIIGQNRDNDIGTEIKSVNKLVKFDGDGLEPILYDNNEKFHMGLESSDTMTFKAWYVTKKDGTNWVDETERNNANIENLNMYEDLENIPEGYVCVGMYFESQGGILNVPKNGNTQYIMIRMKVKDTAKIGKTYGIMQVDDYWLETLDRTTQTATNPDAEYPKTVALWHNQQYRKTQYDENGQIVTGTHNGGFVWGNTVLIIGAESSIGIKSIDDNGEEKVTYDLGRNENVVTLETTPTLKELNSQYPTNIKGATVRIKETLPKELTYVPGSSNYGEPIETIKNEDGTTTYIWDIYNCTVGQAIEPLVIKAEIDSDAKNGDTLHITSIIEPDRELIGLSPIEFRTSTTGIQIVNLASHSLTKETDTRVIENNGEIKYKVTYQNKNDYSMPDFQLLDILPYNGDGRGTQYNGTYTLKDVKVTQTASESGVSNDNLSLYTTTNVDARKITPKDEEIGVSEIWNKKEIGAEINEPVTVLALKGEIAPNTRVEMEITLKTNNNKGGDIYSNSVTAQTSKNTEVITSTNSEVSVVKRIIEGMLWYDTNENGVKDENESYANRVEVELLKADGSKAVDVNGNEVPNMLTDENGKYSFSNLPIGVYVVKIYTEGQYTLTTANVGSNQEINSKFEEENGNKESYEITNLNGLQSPEIIEQNVNAGLVVKDAKVIVHYLEEDSTPNDDSDNKKLLDDKEITQYEVNGEMKNYKLGDSYSVNPENIENYISLRDSGNTTGTFESEVVEVTYYYTYNKQDITIQKIWNDNNDEAKKRPTSIKIELKNGNNVVQEVVLSNANARVSETSTDANIWEATLNNIDIYDVNGQKINYTVDEKENEGTLENYIKTIEGYTITNTFTQNTEKININVNKVWEDSNNYAEKRPEELTLILKQQVNNTSGLGEQEAIYQEVTRITINGTDNKGSNENEWTYTFSNMAKYDQYNNKINYTVEEVVPEFYASYIEKTNEEENSMDFKITNTFSVPVETINIPVTKVWEDNNNRAGKRPSEVTLVLTGKNKEGYQIGEPKKIVLTQGNAVEGQENVWQGTISDLAKYDDKANEINYELSEEDLGSVFYTSKNTTINQATKTITNKFVVPDEKIEISVHKKWEDNNNSQSARPEEVTLYLTGNNQEYETTLTEANKNAEDENIWDGTIGNLPRYDVNGNEITYTLDERPITSEFYAKTNVDQESKTVTNEFSIPTESIQIPVTKVWEDSNNVAGKRPQTIELQIINKATKEVVTTQIMQGNSTTNEGWSYTFEVPKYGETTEEIEYEIGEKDLENEFYESNVDQDTRTITNTSKYGKVVVHHYIMNADGTPTTIKVPNASGVEVQDQIIDGKEGEEYKTTKADVQANYELVAEPTNATGTINKYDANNPQEVIYYYKLKTPSIKDQSITKNGTSTIDNLDDEITYNISYSAEINDYQGNAKVKLVDTLPYQIDTSKSNLADGSYDATSNTITWKEEIRDINSFENKNNEITINKTIKVVYTGISKDTTSINNEVTGQIETETPNIVSKEVKANWETTTGFITNVSVSKIWEDDSNKLNTRPNKVIFKLTGSDGKEYRKDIAVPGTPGTTTTQDEENINKWNDIFENLPKYDENNKEIIYTLTEEEANSGDLKYYDIVVDDANKTVTNTSKYGKVTVHHYIMNTDGSLTTTKVPDTNGTEIPDTIIEGKEGTQYTTTSANNINEKYELVSNATVGQTTGTIKKYDEANPQEVTYYYRLKPAKVIISYKEQGTNQNLEEQQEITGYVDDKYDAKTNYEKAKIEKDGKTYTLVKDTENTTGLMTVEDINVTYYYLQNTKATVRYVERNPETGAIVQDLEEPTVKEGLVGEEFVTNAKAFTGYKLVESPEKTTIKLSKEAQTLIYYYEPVYTGLIENHIDEITKRVLYTEEHEIQVGQAYNIKPRTYEGYDRIVSKDPSNASGVMGEEPITVNYYYIKKAVLEVNYIDKDTGKALTEQIVDRTKHEGDSYTTEKKTFEGYDLVEVPTNAQGTLTVETDSQGNITNNKTVVTYYYTQKAIVEEHHIDIVTGEDIEAPTIYTGHVGDEYITKSKGFLSYELVVDKLPTNAKGTMTEEKIVVNYYYRQPAKVIVHYVDKTTGKELQELNEATGEMEEAKVVIEGQKGDSYTTTAKEFEYYTLAESPAEASGTMKVEITADGKVNNTIELYYYYEQKPFNIAVEKEINAVIVNGNREEPNDRKVAKIEIYRKSTENTSVQVEYKIKVTNKSEITGKAIIEDKIPEGMELANNDGTWEENNGVLRKVITGIEAGETKEYTVLLNWKQAGENMGNKTNVVTLVETANVPGFKDNNAEDNSSEATAVITVETGGAIIGTKEMIIILIALIGIAGILIKYSKISVFNNLNISKHIKPKTGKHMK